MKCPNCGAEGNGTICEYCGSELRAEKKTGEVCSRCGSTNIAFRRENHGEVRGKKSKQVVHRTVGYCKDCGNTWYAAEDTPKKRKTWLWVLGWIFIFPLPLTILLLRKKNMKPVLKYAIIAVAWLIYLLFALSGNSSDKGTTAAEPMATAKEEVQAEAATQKQQTETVNPLIANAEVTDLMNGTGTKAIGTYSVSRATQGECTDEALADWYYNFVLKNPDCNFHVIVYDDVADKGVYANKGFVQKDITIVQENNGNYMTGDDAGSSYYHESDDGKTLKLYTVMADASVVEDVKAKVDAVLPDAYKGGQMYSVDVAGPEGKLDCNLTLINTVFGTADCQPIAVELASKVKELDLGIGYFCIAFQKDDYSLNAVSSIDDLSTQDASEITTQTY